MRYTLVVNPVAEADLAEAKEWYDGQRDGLGTELVVAVRTTIRSIRGHPLMHATVFQDVRKAVVKRFPYAVFYRVDGRQIAVIAVYHTSRDPTGWQSRA